MGNERQQKADLQRALEVGRDALLWKLDGLSDYDVRRPMVPTGTNLLGLLKHVGCVAAGYFGECFGRPFPELLPWFDESAHPNSDMWATADESREDILAFYERCWTHADTSIAALPLDAVAQVPWWREDHQDPTLHLLLVEVTAETHRHAGHADIVRELIDGAAGRRRGVSNLPDEDAAWWAGQHERLEQVARRFAATE